MNGRITTKLLRRVLLAELISFLLLMGIAFGFLRPVLRDQALAEAEATGIRLASEIDSALEGMANTAAFLAGSPELSAAIDSGHTALYTPTLNSLCAISPLPIRSAVLLTGGRQFPAGGELTAEDVGYLYSYWLTTLRGSGQFSSFYSSDGDDVLDSLAYALPGTTPGGGEYLLLIYFDALSLLETIDARLEADYSGYVLASEYGPSFLEMGETGHMAQVLETHKDSPDNYSIRESGGYYLINRVENGWRLGGYLSRADFSRDFNTTLLYISGMCLLLCLISIGFILPMTGGLLRPVYALKSAMDRTAAGDLSVRAEVLSDDELGQLAVYFNDMSGRLEENIRQRIDSEHRAQNTRYSLLVSQVNAHFVYNTMSSVNSLARTGDCPRILAMNTALLRILQGTLVSQDGELFTELQSELALLEQYWQIERIKNGDNIVLTLNIPEELKAHPVPRNFLQPLAENSLHHGLMNEDTGLADGTVCIRAWTGDGQLHISVSDDGRGIPPETMARLLSEQADDRLRTRGRHIGLSNLRQRLRFLYGDQAYLAIESRDGTTVTISFPCKTAE